MEVSTRNHLLFCEHPHVYTLGKSGKDAHLLLDEDAMKQRGVSFYRINRGGDITYHGPGQQVAYPIWDLDKFKRDLHWYLRQLEEVVIQVCDQYGIKAGRLDGATGVWINEDSPLPRKICAMGIRCSRWVSMHGLALNVNTDLSYFHGIVPLWYFGQSGDIDRSGNREESSYGRSKESSQNSLCRDFRFFMGLILGNFSTYPLTISHNLQLVQAARIG